MKFIGRVHRACGLRRKSVFLEHIDIYTLRQVANLLTEAERLSDASEKTACLCSALELLTSVKHAKTSDLKLLNPALQAAGLLPDQNDQKERDENLEETLESIIEWASAEVGVMPNDFMRGIDYNRMEKFITAIQKKNLMNSQMRMLEQHAPADHLKDIQQRLHSLNQALKIAQHSSHKLQESVNEYENAIDMLKGAFT